MRRICVATGNRADFGILLPLIRRLQAAEDVELQTLVTGAHLDGVAGRTVDLIRAAGVPVSAEVEMTLASDSAVAVAKATGLCLISAADALARLRPELVVLLGDRNEILAVAAACTFATIPIAHLHGGETTEGSIDEVMRHAVTKMAHLHFAATETYRRRILQLGEDPARVFDYGTPALDNLTELPRPSVAELEERVGLSLVGEIVVCTFHPETLYPERAAAIIRPTLGVLAAERDLTVVFTRANADVAGEAINAELARFVARRPERRAIVPALGTAAYISLVAMATVVIGNSSSGLIEVPALGTPTINVGERQAGRTRSFSVIDAANDEASIAAALTRARSDGFRSEITDHRPAYGSPGAAERIATQLRNQPLEGLVRKRFVDLPPTPAQSRL